MDFGTIDIFLVVTGVLLVALGGAVFFANIRERANVAFGLFCFFLALWTATIIGFRESETHEAGLVWMKYAYAAAFPVGVSFWFFAQALVKGRYARAFRPWSLRFHVAVAALYATAIIGTDLIVREWRWLPDGARDVDVHPLGWAMYAVLFLAYFLVGNLFLLWKYWRGDDPERRTMRFLILGVFIGGEVFGVLFNLVLPSPLFDQWRWIWAGPLLTAGFIVPFVSYGIFKYGLLNVKIIATETLVTALALLTLINAVSAPTPAQGIFQFTVFAGVVVFGLLLIRSVFAEVRRREEVQKLAAELAERNVQLRKLDELKSTMVSIASHQIRGPLGGIRGYLSMFAEGDLGPLNDQQKDIVALNLNVLSRLINAVETFLDITKIESGKIVLQRDVVDLAEVVDGVVREFEIPVRKKGLAFRWKKPAQPILADIDPEKTKHVVFNLIDNALKYTEAGSIDAALAPEGAWAVLTIADTGMGIPQSDLKRLFGKFERGGLVLDRGGSGLGLYVVKMLTELQGGDVAVSSPGEGNGASFRVRFPLAR